MSIKSPRFSKEGRRKEGRTAFNLVEAIEMRKGNRLAISRKGNRFAFLLGLGATLTQKITLHMLWGRLFLPAVLPALRS